MTGLCKIWREISDETSSANLAKWKKSRVHLTGSQRNGLSVSFHVLWLTNFDVSYFAARKLINQHLHKPLKISFTRTSNSLLGAVFENFPL